MNKFLASLSFILILASCSNAPETETGEIRTLQLLKKTFDDSSKPKRFIDARNLIDRKQIDAANIPVLFVELASGQNGTLTPYPGQGVGQTWLGADGATITLEKGILKASRGMGDDLMGSSSSMPPWEKINNKTETYSRELAHITGNNKISKRVFQCKIRRVAEGEFIKIWDVKFQVDKFEENCANSSLKFKNNYYIDIQGTVRRSLQYHSNTIGSVMIERLDR
ncbi:YjbF family lipoprotein [Paracoccaceae bacterium]|nr:YjbF family lipoprotein [Paracoccaceae bacterium]